MEQCKSSLGESVVPFPSLCFTLRTCNPFPAGVWRLAPAQGLMCKWTVRYWHWDKWLQCRARPKWDSIMVLAVRCAPAARQRPPAPCCASFQGCDFIQVVLISVTGRGGLVSRALDQRQCSFKNTHWDNYSMNAICPHFDLTSWHWSMYSINIVYLFWFIIAIILCDI